MDSRKLLTVGGMLYLLIFFACCSANSLNTSNESEWIYLFNGENLDQWDTYLGRSWNPDENKFSGDSLGLNNDPLQVFTVVQEDGENAIRISGQVWGGISTKSSFENYHLQLQFKWGNKKWAPRDRNKRDSGPS